MTLVVLLRFESVINDILKSLKFNFKTVWKCCFNSRFCQIHLHWKLTKQLCSKVRPREPCQGISFTWNCSPVQLQQTKQGRLFCTIFHLLLPFPRTAYSFPKNASPRVQEQLTPEIDARKEAPQVDTYNFAPHPLRFLMPLCSPDCNPSRQGNHIPGMPWYAGCSVSARFSRKTDTGKAAILSSLSCGKGWITSWLSIDKVVFVLFFRI